MALFRFLYLPQITTFCQKSRQQNLSPQKFQQQEMWKFHENQVFQQLHEARKTFQEQIILLMYLCFNDFYGICDESRVNKQLLWNFHLSI